MSRSRKIGGSLGLLFTLAIFFVVGLVYHQRIIDQFKFWNYQPSSAITNLADRGGLSDGGKFYFYVAWPKLESADEFNADCRRVEQASPILGCYNRASDQIHIYDIQNQELDGIKEVTAAHEMLHVVFARASASEQKQLEQWLEAAYAKLKNPKLEERMAYYDRSQPGSRVDELHSIIGTEFTDISDDLEKYYAQFFDDRNKIVALNAAYNQKFSELEAEAATLMASLEQQLADIEAKTASYEADIQALNSKIENFNSRADSGYFDTRRDFEAERWQLNEEIRAINLRQAELADLVDSYNRDVERVNILGSQMDQLNSSLDSLRAVQ